MRYIVFTAVVLATSMAIAQETTKTRFPIGIYVAIPPNRMTSQPDQMRKDLDGIAEGKFNFLINYASGGGSDAEIRAYYDELDQRGLTEFFSLKDYYKDIGNKSWQIEFPESEEEAIRSRVKKYKDLPALAGWYIIDELPQNPPLVEQHKKWVKLEDEKHPVLSVLSLVQREFRRWVPTCDILALDYYPIDQSWVSDIGSVTRHFVNEAGEHPAWFIVQAHGGYVYNDEVRGDKPTPLPPSSLLSTYGRAPTPQEMRAMVYLALVNGADGVGFYYHKDILLAYDSQTRWPAVKSIAREVDALSDMLLSPTIARETIKSDNPNIEWIVKDVGGVMHILAVNSGRELRHLTLKLPKKMSKATVLQGVGLAYAYEDQLLISLDALDAIAVKVE